MITTIKSIIEELHLEVGKQIECSVWIGRDYIRNAKKVMLIDENTLYLRAEQALVRNDDGDLTMNKCGKGFINYTDDPERQIVLAYTIDEAKADANTITAERRKQEKDACKEVKELLAKVNETLKLISYDRRGRLAKEILKQKDEKYSELMDFNHWSMGLHKAEMWATEDVVSEMVAIHTNQKIIFNDSDNGGIKTTISLNNIVSVECNSKFNGKLCITINTSNGHEYHVYRNGKDGDERNVYWALFNFYY